MSFLRYTSLFLLASLLLSGCGPAPAPPVSKPVASLYARELLDASIAAVKENKLEEALNKAEEAVAEDPDFAEAQAQRALLLARCGMRREALAGFKKTLAIEADLPEIHLFCGMLLELEGNLEAARVAYITAEETYAAHLDSPQFDPESALYHAIAAYLARGQVSGFTVINKVIARHPAYRRAKRVQAKMEADDRAFFLNFLARGGF